MLSSLKISHKLALLVIVAVVAFVVSQAFSIITERNNSERLGEVRNQLYPSLELSTINRGLLQLIENQINSAVTTGDDQQIAATREQLAEIIENLDRIAQLNPSQQSDVKALKSELNGYYSTATRIATAIIEGTADFNRIGQEASANAERLAGLRSDLDQMRNAMESRLTQAIDDTTAASSEAATVSVTIVVVALVVLIALSLIIGRSVSGSLQQIISSLRNMASGEGDLTSRIEYTGKDELRDLVDQFNRFVEKLHKSFATIQQDIGELNGVATHLGSTSRTNLERISQQAQAISSTRNSVEELVKSVEEVAGFASSASDQTQDASKFATTGQQKVEGNIQTIQRLMAEIENTASLVNQFDEFSVKVGGLLETIQTVAEQTNLLALNAAIEAARAGEHGRGFAVVADEVRGLAVRTHKATEEIQQVISELSKASGAAVHSMQGSVDMARQGVDATTESGEVLRKILENVQQISELNEQIAAATYEQSTTFSEVTGHMGDMHRNAEAVMESTDELDTVSRKIQDVSNGLQSVAGQFRV
ncbi:methyl-accepting chemotaxis protein [Marinobacter nauticus]|uniref:methyl-accepting chemotaxis protein n=1 Tax=Marinobacter nauticus TaxID=2743 RepID=UPI0037368645|nr:methyl-accepting chemotaxis protein [Pseudomonadales bacterium]